MDIAATDEDGDDVQFVPDGTVLPEGSSLETLSNTPGCLQARLTWEPERGDIGDHEVVLAVSDGQDEVSEEVTIHVARGAIVEDPKLYVSDITYNVMGQIERIEYGTGTVKDYTYNDLNFRLERILTTNNQGIVIQDLNYTYDAVGNITAVTDNVNTATQTFGYDHLNRLVAARDESTYGEKTYSYDTIGNILEKDGRTYTYAGGAAGPHAVTSLSDGTSFAYDANGSMAERVSSEGSFAYDFDAENRLASVEKDGTLSAAFRYDGDGGRTRKVAYGAALGIPLSSMAYPELLQDGLGEDDLVTHFVGELYEVDNLHEVKHVYLGSERILSVHDGVEQYIHGDHLGSSNVVEDQFGALVQINEYQPFGDFSRRDQYATGGQESDLYFTQQILDDETGLYYYGARYYDPLIGRFISADPTVQHPNDPQDLNRYAYCRNNPINLVDPSGYGWFSDFIGDFTQFLGDAIAVITAPVTFMITGGNYYAAQQTFNFYHNDFSRYALPTAVAGISIALTGSPIPGMAALSSSAALGTGAGRKVTRQVGDEFFDDVLGMRPKTARIWSAVALNTMMSLGIERGLAHLTGSNLTISSDRIGDDDFVKAQEFPFASDEFQYGPSAKSTLNDSINWNEKYFGLTNESGELVGGIGKRNFSLFGLTAHHTGANIMGASDSVLPAWSYATLGGTCQQATNLTMLSAGYSNTILGFSQIRTWDMYVTTAVYGNYGGQLPSRIISGMQAHDNY